MLHKTTCAVALLALCAFPFRAMAQDPVPLYPENYKVLFENDRVRVLDFQLRKGAKEQFHAHPAAVTYVPAPFKIRFTFPDGKTAVPEAKAGDVFFGEAHVHASENVGESDAHGVLIEMKSASKTNVAAPSGDELLTAVTFIRGIAGREDELKTELLAIATPPGRKLETLPTTSINRPSEKTNSCASKSGVARPTWKPTNRRRI